MKGFRTTLAGLAMAGAVGCSHNKPPPPPPPTAQPAPQAARELPSHAKSFADLAAVDVPGLNTKVTPEQLEQACADAEKTADAKLAALVAVPEMARTFGNSFATYEQVMTDYADTVGRLAFLKDIHTDAKVRAAAAACEERAGKYAVKVGARKDLYTALKTYLDRNGKTDPLDAVDRRLIEIAMRDFKRNGLGLSDADREKLVGIRQRLTELATRYSANLDNDTTTLEATGEELAGLPKDMIERLQIAGKGAAPAGSAPVHGKPAPAASGAPVHGQPEAKSKAVCKKKGAEEICQGAPKTRYILTTKYPDYFPVMENAKNEELRRRMFLAFNGRQAAQNLPLLTEAIALRDQAAKLLGYPTHADFVTEDRMAKNAKTVADFLNRLRLELVPARNTLDAEMLALKTKETKNKKAQLQDWDWMYYLNQIKKQKYAIDDEQVRQYFPADKVMAGMFQVYATLFNVKFDEVPNPDAWADGVKLYAIHDGLDGKGKLLAKFYVDLFPREGKYGHAASFPFGVARETASGYQIPLSALVVNFNPPSNGQSAKLSFSEVDTLFHEFGHIMHASLTQARYNSLAGTNVSVDFVEAPSQMLENWVYRPEVLALITQDPKDPSKTMPGDLIQKLGAARTFNAGIRYTRQVFLATFDQKIHTSGEKVDPDQVDHDLRAQIMGYPVNKDEHFAASFGHMMGGYDAGYYGYLWSEVFADDMFTKFEQGGVLNPQVGKQYRDIILAKGRVEEPDQLLREFLGREPNEQAFLRLTGIKSDAGNAGAPVHH